MENTKDCIRNEAPKKKKIFEKGDDIPHVLAITHIIKPMICVRAYLRLGYYHTKSGEDSLMPSCESI